MCKYYGYIRVSTETQAEKGYGLDTQREALARYAADKGIKLEHVFEDAGISGYLKDDEAEDDTISKRHGLIELLATIDEGDTVIVLNTSRLWRSDVTKVIVRSRLKKSKANVISIEQPRFDFYGKNPSDRLIETMLEALDEYDRTCIALKLARGRAIKAKAGDKPAGLCPYGYEYSNDKKSVIVNADEAAVVKMMFTEGQKGRSLGQIADTLNGKGLQTRKGNAWSKGSIRAILKNEFYTGMLHHAGQPIKGNHEAIISKIQFGKVQAQLERRHK